MSLPPNHPLHPWARLTAAARQVSDDRDASAPYGFATRVVALAPRPERGIFSLPDRFALRAVGVAALLALGSVALNYQAFSIGLAGSQVAAIEDTDFLSRDDAVSIVLDIGD